MANVLQRQERYGEPYRIGEMFRLQKDKAGAQLEAACELVTHQLGWELRLTIGGSLQRSQVCRSQDEVLDTADQWKASTIEKAGPDTRPLPHPPCVKR